MKTYILILLLLASPLWAAPSPNTERIIGRIAKKDQSTYVLRSAPGAQVMAQLANPELRKVIDELRAGDEVLAQGHVEYASSFQDDRITYTPVFVIEKLSPISLQRLGVSDKVVPDFSPSPFSLAAPYSPRGLTTTPQVTSSLILTASVLLFQTLVAPAGVADPRQDISRGLTFFAGTLATGIFLFDDLH